MDISQANSTISVPIAGLLIQANGNNVGVKENPRTGSRQKNDDSVPSSSESVNLLTNVDNSGHNPDTSSLFQINSKVNESKLRNSSLPNPEPKSQIFKISNENVTKSEIFSEGGGFVEITELPISNVNLSPISSTYKPNLIIPIGSIVKKNLEESTSKFPSKETKESIKNDYLERKKMKLKLKEKKTDHFEKKKMKFNLTGKITQEQDSIESTDSSYQLENPNANLDMLLINPQIQAQVSPIDSSSSLTNVGLLQRTSGNLGKTRRLSEDILSSTPSFREEAEHDSKSPPPQPLSRIMPSLEEGEDRQNETSTTGSISLKRYTTFRTTISKRTTDSVLYPGHGSNVSVCSNDPCGAGVACHPTGKSFLCFCSDGTEVAPREPCPDIRPVNVTPPAISMPQATESLMKPSQILILGSVITMAFCIIGVIALICFRRRSLCKIMRQRTSLKFSKSNSDSVIKISTLHTYNFASNPNYYTSPPDQLPLQALAVQLISKDQIVFLGELGEGCFGRVYKGEYIPKADSDHYEEGMSSRSSSPSVSSSEEDAEDDKDLTKEEKVKKKKGEKDIKKKTVAVKVLKELVGMEAEADFMREVEIMASFRHPNILSLVGIVVEDTGGTPWMVFEFMPLGDLAEVLRSCSKQYGNNCPPVKTLGKMELLNICTQVAAGMEYLSLQHFVHRDLACRNCLVGKNLTVKISDFGMSRDVYTCDYYKVGGSRMLPVRWMAPESILYGKFTLESDVWSFGVVLWEIYSFGKQPYYGNSNEEVVQLILQGILLSPSESCPPLVREVMRLCWSTEAHNRLTFPEIVRRLKCAQEALEEEILCQELFQHINYSRLSLHDSAVKLETDKDLYLLPKKNVVTDEYLTVLGSA